MRSRPNSRTYWRECAKRIVSWIFMNVFCVSIWCVWWRAFLTLNNPAHNNGSVATISIVSHAQCQWRCSNWYCKWFCAHKQLTIRHSQAANDIKINLVFTGRRTISHRTTSENDNFSMLIIDMKITNAPINLPTLRYRSHLTHSSRWYSRFVFQFQSGGDFTLSICFCIRNSHPITWLQHDLCSRW